MRKRRDHWMGLMFFLALAMPANAAAPSKLVATSYGAAGEVSGSLHLLDTGNARWMIDCGAVFGEDSPSKTADASEPSERPKDKGVPQTLPTGVESVDAVFITHAHTDHIGRLPLLVQHGFAGPIYMTDGTAAIAVPMLRAAVRGDRLQPRDWVWSKAALAVAKSRHKPVYVHWRDCKYRTEIAAANTELATCSAQDLFDRFAHQTPRVKASLCASCVDDEVEAVTRLVRRWNYGAVIETAPGVRATFLDAGHIPGSASVLMEVTLGERMRRVLFSGDLGNGLSPLQPGPRPVPECDAAFIECTYGTVRREESVKRQRADFRRAVAEAVARGDVVWIPCFALDRTQKILYELHVAQREKLLPERLPIYCPSPTAKEVTAVYNEHRHDGWFGPEIAGDENAFAPNDVRGTVPSFQRLPRPCVILSTSDMLMAQWMRGLLVNLLPETSTSVFLVGYQDPGSAGDLLKQGVGEVEIDGGRVPVRAKVRAFQCFSGHGDSADIDAWLTNVSKQATLVLVHGGQEELKTRAEQLRRQGRGRIVIAKPGESLDLER